MKGLMLRTKGLRIDFVAGVLWLPKGKYRVSLTAQAKTVGVGHVGLAHAWGMYSGEAIFLPPAALRSAARCKKRCAKRRVRPGQLGYHVRSSRVKVYRDGGRALS